jgi:hypothetical protein
VRSARFPEIGVDANDAMKSVTGNDGNQVDLVGVDLDSGRLTSASVKARSMAQIVVLPQVEDSDP